jgi:DNA-binding HxlR family transcriptional regulator
MAPSSKSANSASDSTPTASPVHRSTCPVACTLDLVGDRWTLLIIRDMMFFGKQRFEEFLASPEGISTNILANRLKLLEELGLVAKQPYGNHPRRMSYSLTEQGQSLRPVLKTIALWGLKQIPATQLLATEKRTQLFD